MVRAWEPPASPYGRGHRGADLAAPPGTEVRAAAPGRVSFAGPVAGRGVLSIELAGTGDPPLRTTYEPVRPLVAQGALVGEGEVVAVVAEGPAHCPRGCLHWGLRRGTEYLDPLSLLPASALRRGPSRLLPVFGVPRPPSAPGAAARLLADATASPSRAGADAVQALVLVTAATLSRRALRHRREGRIRRSGRWRALCGGAWSGAAALMRRHRARAQAWADRTRARQSRARPWPSAGQGPHGVGSGPRARGSGRGRFRDDRAGRRASGGGAGARGQRRGGEGGGAGAPRQAASGQRRRGRRGARPAAKPYRYSPGHEARVRSGGRWAQATPVLGMGEARTTGRVRGAVSRQGRWTRHGNGPGRRRWRQTDPARHGQAQGGGWAGRDRARQSLTADPRAARQAPAPDGRGRA
ncbi:M23 family metallopeptidase [Streptomyces wuyuanensis]|uniref:M23 family metallopeptidase n=1 Tax=Streptomyces wuyuanensis TaxID=1196353 RepID=UPI003D727392